MQLCAHTVFLWNVSFSFSGSLSQRIEMLVGDVSQSVHQTETSWQLLDKLPWNVVQTFMVHRGWILYWLWWIAVTLVILWCFNQYHLQVKMVYFKTKYTQNCWHSHQPQLYCISFIAIVTSQLSWGSTYCRFQRGSEKGHLKPLLKHKISSVSAVVVADSLSVYLHQHFTPLCLILDLPT